MSALAARRAAAAAVTSTDTLSSTPNKAKKVKPVKSVKPIPKPASPPSASDSEEELQAILDTPNKRRKIDTPPPSRPRYFAEPEKPTNEGTSRRKQVKRFSPSAPVSESGEDSSVDEEGGVGEGVVGWGLSRSGVLEDPVRNGDTIRSVWVGRPGFG
jgi:hypothetical protein